jgi:hypothetical protein
MVDLDTLIREADPARDLVVPEVDRAEIRRFSERPPARMRTRRGWLGTGIRAVPILVSLAVASAVVVFAIGIHAHRVGNQRSSIKRSTSTSQTRAHRGLRFLAVRQLAQGQLPRQRTFAIFGERYRFWGRVYFSLEIDVNRPGAPSNAGTEGTATLNLTQSPGALAVGTLTVDCSARPSTLVFGLLRASSDHVVVLRGGRTDVPQRVAIPGILHARGTLIYALADQPGQLVVRQPDGTPIVDDRLLGNNRHCPRYLRHPFNLLGSPYAR